MSDDLLLDVKAHLIIEDVTDDAYLRELIKSALAYAEGYQHLPKGTYQTYAPEGATRQAVLMLVAHLYEARDGATAGFTAVSAESVWQSVNRLLQLDRNWKV